ncbi:MAG: hypothetical protein VKP62_14395 [Candidatus Sericytochromatia bacterium]|nr:hypothetical protein [Candidatus Sericytochromatia bacterium]
MTATPSLMVLRPGRMPAEATVWHSGREWALRISSFNQDSKPASEEEARVRAGFLAARETLLAVWATAVGPELGAPDVRALEVRRLQSGLWAFELSNGGAMVIPSAWIGPGVDESEEAPIPLRDGMWWLWPEAEVAVEVGDLVLRQLSGVKEGIGLFCAPLPAADPSVDPAATLQGPLFGLILARQGLLGRNELEAALRAQQRSLAAGKRLKLGETCVMLGLLEPYQLNFTLAFQHQMQRLDPLDRMFVDHLLQLDLVSPVSMLVVLDRHAKEGGPLRELIVAEGLTSPRVLQAFELNPVPGGEAGSSQTQAEGRPAAAPHLRPGESAGDPNLLPAIGSAMGGAGLRSLLGAILQREDILSHEQLQHVVVEQIRRRRLGKHIAFGQLALELGYIDETKLNFAVALQSRLSVEGSGPRPLGLFLVEHGVIKPSQLAQALDEAERSGTPLGQVLVSQGRLTREQLRVFLDMQRRAIEMA